MGFRQQLECANSLRVTLDLFRQGKSVPEIAHERSLSVSTIENHLRELLKKKQVEIHELLAKEKLELIKSAIGDCKFLKEIKDKLPDSVTYGEIRYVLTAVGRFPPEKTPIMSAINTYVGNNCHRKCFSHPNIILGCCEKFQALAKKFDRDQTTFEGFNATMKTGDIGICRLPPEKRAKCVSWAYFERLKSEGTDFWDATGL